MNPDDTQPIPPAQQVLYSLDDDDLDEDGDTVCEPTPLLADGQPD